MKRVNSGGNIEGGGGDSGIVERCGCVCKIFRSCGTWVGYRLLWGMRGALSRRVVSSAKIATWLGSRCEEKRPPQVCKCPREKSVWGAVGLKRQKFI
jgi:hypothetical protein